MTRPATGYHVVFLQIDDGNPSALQPWGRFIWRGFQLEPYVDGTLVELRAVIHEFLELLAVIVC